jgi:hypothetical protein
LSPDVVRMFPRDHRTVVFQITNPLSAPVSGHLDFDLPDGLRAEPNAPTFGPIAANGSEQIAATLQSDNPAAGRHIVPYNITYELGHGTPTLTRARSFEVTIGPVLELVYLGNAQPAMYQIDVERYIAKADMFAGLFRYLSDDDGNVRLNGDPLFTFSDGVKPLLFEGTEHAFTWPVETPAQLTAHAYDLCRWQAMFFADRIMVRMDRDWTQFERAYFTIPGKWISPSGSPRWRTVLTSDGLLGKTPTPGSALTVKAAELNFPGANWNICFDFIPAQRVTFHGTELKFSIGSLTNDQWTVGFCAPGTLDSWRWKPHDVTSPGTPEIMGDEKGIGLTGEARATFIKGAFDECNKANSAMPTYCRCYAKAIADSVSINELEQTQESGWTALRPKIEAAARRCRTN